VPRAPRSPDGTVASEREVVDGHELASEQGGCQPVDDVAINVSRSIASSSSRPGPIPPGPTP